MTKASPASSRASRPASSSLERSVPSTHRAATAAPAGSLERMASASLARARSISAGAGFSGRRCSGSSTRSSLQQRLRRLQYSAAASM